MRFLIDARTVRSGRTGIGYYTESMIRSLDRVGTGHEIEILTVDPSAWDPPLQSVRSRATAWDYEAHPASEIHAAFVLPRELFAGDWQAFWGPAFLLPWFAPRRCTRVVTIHDMIAFDHPDVFPRKFAFLIRQHVRIAAHAADLVVVPSASVASDFIRRFPAAESRVRVIHEAADAYFTPEADTADLPQGLDVPFVLALGAGDPRKNVATLLHAWGRLDAAVPPATTLAVVGNPSDEERRLAAAAQRPVRWLGRVTRAQLRALYCHAQLFAFPSVAEGFGLPVLEAMQCGCPVLASSAGSLPEVGSAAARYAAPDDASAWARQIADVLSDSGARHHLQQAGQTRAAQFSWDLAAAQLLAEIQRCREAAA